FQAEDGIRDKLVTGVQTCALPISVFPSGALRPDQEITVGLRFHVEADGTATDVQVIRSSGFPDTDATAKNAIERWHFLPATVNRSEERRVGKEWRTRWAA